MAKKLETFIQLVDGVEPKETPRCDMSQGLRELAIRGAALFCCGMNHRVYSVQNLQLTLVDSRPVMSSTGRLFQEPR